MNKPITSRDIFFGPDKIVRIRLGDILVPKSQLKARNQADLCGLMPLAILAVGFFMDDTYFTVMGLDELEYSTSKHIKNGLVLLSKRGKEIEMSEASIVRLFKLFRCSRSSDSIDGLTLYLRTLVTNPSDLRDSSVYKIDRRLINMIEWPDTALRTWASKHLCVPSKYIRPIERLDDRRAMINSVIQLSITRAKTFSEENKITTGILKDLYLPVDPVICSSSTPGRTWNPERREYSPNREALSDCLEHLREHGPSEVSVDSCPSLDEQREQVIQYRVNLAQAERMVANNVNILGHRVQGERMAAPNTGGVEPAMEWGTIDARGAAKWGTIYPPEGEASHPIAERSTIDPPGVVENELVVCNENDYYNEDDPDEMR